MRLLSLALLSWLLITTAAVGQGNLPADAKSRLAEIKARYASQRLTSQLSTLVRSPSLQKELGIDEVQLIEIRENTKVYQTKMMEFYKLHRDDQQEISKLFKDGDHELARSMSEAYQEKQAAMVDEMSVMADALLLPDQMKRLKQILKQQDARRRNPYHDEFGMPLALADDLKLTADEKSKLNQVIQEARAEYYKKMDDLKEKTNNKILNSLPAGKRKQFEESIGERYDPEAQTRSDAEERRKKYELDRKKRMEDFEKAKQRAEVERAKAAASND